MARPDRGSLREGGCHRDPPCGPGWAPDVAGPERGAQRVDPVCVGSIQVRKAAGRGRGRRKSVDAASMQEGL